MDAAEHEEGPTPVRRAAPLSRLERRRVAVVAGAPVVGTFLFLLPVALTTTVTFADVAGAAVVLGGLVGLVAAAVAVDRAQARRCPRCQAPRDGDADRCSRCGYDLDARPRYACRERHLTYLDTDGDGRCRCGQPLEPLPTARGVRAQVVAVARITGLLVGFLSLAGVVLNLLEGRL